ncbi:hypothetical protein RvVAT039_01600 [Agrobacterium vitis]|nr:hypothetical protein RvVAT039_01600 [Agrobacterium vitis]
MQSLFQPGSETFKAGKRCAWRHEVHRNEIALSTNQPNIGQNTPSNSVYFFCILDYESNRGD